MQAPVALRLALPVAWPPAAGPSSRASLRVGGGGGSRRPVLLVGGRGKKCAVNLGLGLRRRRGSVAAAGRRRVEDDGDGEDDEDDDLVIEESVDLDEGDDGVDDDLAEGGLLEDATLEGEFDDDDDDVERDTEDDIRESIQARITKIRQGRLQAGIPVERSDRSIRTWRDPETGAAAMVMINDYDAEVDMDDEEYWVDAEIQERFLQDTIREGMERGWTTPSFLPRTPIQLIARTLGQDKVIADWEGRWAHEEAEEVREEAAAKHAAEQAAEDASAGAVELHGDEDEAENKFDWILGSDAKRQQEERRRERRAEEQQRQQQQLATAAEAAAAEEARTIQDLEDVEEELDPSDFYVSTMEERPLRISTLSHQKDVRMKHVKRIVFDWDEERIKEFINFSPIDPKHLTIERPAERANYRVMYGYRPGFEEVMEAEGRLIDRSPVNSAADEASLLNSDFPDFLEGGMDAIGSAVDIGDDEEDVVDDPLEAVIDDDDTEAGTSAGPVSKPKRTEDADPGDDWEPEELEDEEVVEDVLVDEETSDGTDGGGAGGRGSGSRGTRGRKDSRRPQSRSAGSAWEQSEE